MKKNPEIRILKARVDFLKKNKKDWWSLVLEKSLKPLNYTSKTIIAKTGDYNLTPKN